MSGLVERVLSGDELELVEHRRSREWLAPMPATLTDERFSDPDWIYERKLDGERALAFKRGSRVRLMTRNRKCINGNYPEIVSALERQELVIGGFTELTGHGKLRHPRFLGLRRDTAASEVVRERPSRK